MARCWKAPAPPGADSRRYLPRFAENAIWDGIGARPGRKCPIWHVRGVERRLGARRRGSSRLGRRRRAAEVRERDVLGAESVILPHLGRSGAGTRRSGARKCHSPAPQRKRCGNATFPGPKASRIRTSAEAANALPRGRVRGRASGKGWARTRQRLRREAKNSLSWGPATWIMITTMRMTPLMVSWMRESILRAMMILSMTS